MKKTYDRAAEDLGNIVGLEHLNLRVPDQRLATLFYISGLGLTRDPYLVTGVNNMWINAGRSQFHLPVGPAQKMRGRIGLVAPDLAALVRRLDALGDTLAGTEFAFVRRGRAGQEYLDIICPWGNRFRCHAPQARFGPVALALAYLEFDVRPGAADAIARFYREILLAPAAVAMVNRARVARVSAGAGQELRFRETASYLADYDGHHIQVYVGNFSEPHARLQKLGLITEESNQHQYRFLDIVDPNSGPKNRRKAGAPAFRLEHEVRSMTHPLYARPLINRNPEQSNNSYAAGHQDQAWTLPQA